MSEKSAESFFFSELARTIRGRGVDATSEAQKTVAPRTGAGHAKSFISTGLNGPPSNIPCQKDLPEKSGQIVPFESMHISPPRGSAHIAQGIPKGPGKRAFESGIVGFYHLLARVPKRRPIL